MRIYKNRVLSGLSIGIISLVFMIYIDFLYSGQGYSVYIYLPVQIIVLVFLSFLATKSNFLSLKYFSLIFFSLMFYLFVRGTGNDRTPFLDIKTLMNKDKLQFEDIVNENSLIRKLAVEKFDIREDYFYLSYSNFKKQYEIETIVYLYENKTFQLYDTSEMTILEKCLYIKKERNENYCFTQSILDIAFMNDSCSIIVLKSNEISANLRVDNFLINW